MGAGTHTRPGLADAWPMAEHYRNWFGIFADGFTPKYAFSAPNGVEIQFTVKREFGKWIGARKTLDGGQKARIL